MPSHRTSILVALDWNDYRIIRGIARYALEANWHLSSQMIHSRNVLRGWRGQGAILGYGPHLTSFVDELKVPMVDITLSEISVPIPRIVVDNDVVGNLAATHLQACGFQHFAFYGSRFSWATPYRHSAFRDALRGLGVADARIHHLHHPGGGIPSQWDRYIEAMQAQLDALPKPLGVYVSQEGLAANLLEVAIAIGLRVPEDLAVLGTDNITHICECQAIPLSSVDTRHEELGYQAAALLAEVMRGDVPADAAPRMVQPGQVVRRRSTDVVAVAHEPVSRALAFMRDHFAEPIGMSDLQRVSGMSDRGLQIAFSTTLGRTPGAELRRLRLLHAQHLLSGSDDKVESIAHACGYSNAVNLGAAFKRELGCTPTAYRKRHRPG